MDLFFITYDTQSSKLPKVDIINKRSRTILEQQELERHTAISFKASADLQSRTAPHRSIKDPSSRTFDSSSTYKTHAMLIELMFCVPVIDQHPIHRGGGGRGEGVATII